MKKIILAFSILLFNGCASSLPSAQPDLLPPMAAEDSSAPEGEVVPDPSVKWLDCGMLRHLDPDECERRANEAIAQMLAEEIISTYDLGRCPELPGPLVDSCQQVIAASGIQGPLSLAERKQLDQALLAASCQDLPAGNGARQYCQSQSQASPSAPSAYNPALEARNLDECQSLDTPQLQSQCRSRFGS